MRGVELGVAAGYLKKEGARHLTGTRKCCWTSLHRAGLKVRRTASCGSYEQYLLNVSIGSGP